MEIQYLADVVANNLGIVCPPIRYVSELATPTQLGAFSPNDNVLYIKEGASPLDQAFAVAHELRHVWQVKTGWIDFDRHLLPVETDTVVYNMQSEEIDANAFSTIVLVDLFGVKPLFNGLPKEILLKIEERIKEITSEKDFV